MIPSNYFFAFTFTFYKLYQFTIIFCWLTVKIFIIIFRLCVFLTIIILFKKFIFFFIKLILVMNKTTLYLIVFFVWWFVLWKLFWVFILFVKWYNQRTVWLVCSAAFFSIIFTSWWRNWLRIILCKYHRFFDPVDLIFIKLRCAIKSIAKQDSTVMAMIWADDMFHVNDIKWYVHSNQYNTQQMISLWFFELHHCIWKLFVTFGITQGDVPQLSCHCELTNRKNNYLLDQFFVIYSWTGILWKVMSFIT